MSENKEEEQTLKMTELDYLTAVPHLQMIKAALPYINASEQKFVSLFVKASELQHTMKLFNEKEEGMVGICSLDEDEPSSPLDMLNAMKPYGSESEQEFIDLIINFLESSRIYQSYRESNESQEELHAAEHPHPTTFIPGRTPGNESFNRRPGPGPQAPPPQRQKREENNQRNNGRRIPLEQIKNFLPPEQQSKLETAQLLMQTFQQFT